MDEDLQDAPTRLEEIQAEYERIGLGSPEARASFSRYEPAATQMHFQVIISRSSQPQFRS